MHTSSHFFDTQVEAPFYSLTTTSVTEIPIRTSLAGALNTRGGKKFRFSTEIAVYLGKVRDWFMVTMDHYWEVIAGRLICVISEDLEWRWKERNARYPFFSGASPCGLTQNNQIQQRNTRWDGRVSSWSSTPPSPVSWLQRPQDWDLLHARYT